MHLRVKYTASFVTLNEVFLTISPFKYSFQERACITKPYPITDTGGQVA